MKLSNSLDTVSGTKERAQQRGAGSTLDSDDAFLVNLGRRVVARRAEIDITQVQLALSAGISARYLHDVEKGRQNISVLILRKLSVALKTPPEQLLNIE